MAKTVRRAYSKCSFSRGCAVRVGDFRTQKRVKKQVQSVLLYLVELPSNINNTFVQIYGKFILRQLSTRSPTLSKLSSLVVTRFLPIQMRNGCLHICRPAGYPLPIQSGDGHDILCYSPFFIPYIFFRKKPWTKEVLDSKIQPTPTTRVPRTEKIARQ